MKNFILRDSKIKSKEKTLSLILWNIINSINRLNVVINKMDIDIRELVQYFKKKHPIYRCAKQNDARNYEEFFWKISV